MNFIKKKSSIINSTATYITISIALHFALIFSIISVVNQNKISTNIGSNVNFQQINLSFINEQKNIFKQTKTNEESIIKKKNSQKISKNKNLKSQQKSKTNKIPTVSNSDLAGNKPSPYYPRRSLLLKQEGKVVLKALVDDEGNVLEVTIVSSSGFALLDKSARSTIKKWKFHPSNTKNGSMFWVKIPVEFTIS